MAEDIKDETSEVETPEQTEEISSDGLIPEDGEDTPVEEASETEQEEQTPDSDEDTPQEDDGSQNENQDDDTEDEIIDDPEHSVQKKQSKLQKILIITIGVLSGVLVLGFILYLFGVFDPEPPKPVQTEEAVVDMNQTKQPEIYIFDSKDINIDRLNGKLRILTKYEIIGTAEEERQKDLEKNSKLSTEQINELLEAEQKAKEAEELKKQQEALAAQKALEEQKRKEQEQKVAQKVEKEQEAKEEGENPYDLLKFIQVSVNKSALAGLKDDLEKAAVAISNCEDNSRSFLLIGPFKSNTDLNSIFRSIYPDITQTATKKDLARLEYNRICK